jgi:HAMP domain-containing protein
MVGAVIIYLYFHFILPVYTITIDIPGYYPPLFAAIGTALLCLVGFFLINRDTKIMFDVAYDHSEIKSLEESEIYHIQREALRFPITVSGVSFMIWILAGFIFGFLEPLITAKIFNIQIPHLIFCMRRFIGISLLGGGITSLVLFFILENAWRSYIPNFFPEGHLNRVKHVFKLNMRRRFLIVFLSIILIPLPAMGLTIYANVMQMNLADALTRSRIMISIVWELGFIVLDALVIVLILAYFLSKSVLVPLHHIKEAVKAVENNNLDVHVDILSNDELGDVAEGFNLMIHSLKENRKARESIEKYRAIA